MKSYREARKRKSGAVVDEGAESTTYQQPQNRTVTERSRHIEEDDGVPPVGIEEDEDAQSDPAEPGPSQTLQTSQHVANLLKKKKANKENVPQSQQQPAPRVKPRMFNEPQEDARRVEWDDPTQVASQRQEQPAAGRREQDEVSEDDGFENDQRPVNAARRSEAASSARKPESPISRPSPKRQRVEQSERVESVNYRPSQEAESDSDDNNDRRRFVKYQQSTARSIQGLAKARSGQPQTRTPWSSEEVAALLEYIEELGTSWANIKKVDESWDADSETYEGPRLLARRDQVALKDKARNLKLDYLK
jgi:hypothetical protein